MESWETVATNLLIVIPKTLTQKGYLCKVSIQEKIQKNVHSNANENMTIINRYLVVKEDNIEDTFPNVGKLQLQYFINIYDGR